jgi:hypothetical protein
MSPGEGAAIFGAGCAAALAVIGSYECWRVKRKTAAARAERVRLIEQTRRAPQVYPEGPDVTWRRSS